LPGGRLVVLADGDVDGLGAACVVWDALGEREKLFLTPPKGRNAFGDEAAALVAQQEPKGLFVLDLGVSPRVIAPGVPTLILDHHHPRGEPEGAVVLSGYGLDPTPTSSLLAWRVAGTAENAWKANLGNQGDMGPSDPELDDQRAGGTKRAFDMAKSLLNSAKRSSNPDLAVPAAFRVLETAASPKEVVEATGPDAEVLRQYADEVKRELNEAKRHGPKFSKTEPVAMIRFSSPARVHPLIAQSWRGRLPKYAIMAVNDGYLPGRTQFSMRGNAGIDLLEILARYGKALAIDEPEYGHGHHAATGGSLPTETFEMLIAAMGFA
jgi:single-stranded-DNA-specific exonuclease